MFHVIDNGRIVRSTNDFRTARDTAVDILAPERRKGEMHTFTGGTVRTDEHVVMIAETKLTVGICRSSGEATTA